MVKKFLILIIGTLAGLLLILQWRSYETIANNLRGQRMDIAHEIAILVDNNIRLRKQLGELTLEKELYNSAYQTSQQIADLIVRYEELSGYREVTGEGVILVLPAVPTLADLTDLLDEVFQLGVTAVAINDVRLTNSTAGFSAYNDTLVFDGRIITSPLEIKMIGNGEAITSTLDRADSTLFRISQKFGTHRTIEMQKTEVKISSRTKENQLQ